MADNIYDNTITFHPTGEIKPLSYIKNTIDLGASKFLLTTKNFGLIATPTKENSNKKLFKLNENLIHTFSGTTNDGTLIIHKLIEKLTKQKIFHGVFAYEELYDEISVELSRRTMSSDRLFSCVSSSICRIKNDEGAYEYNLIECSPFGEVSEFTMNASGHRAESVLSMMEKENLEGMSVDDVVLRLKECYQSVFSTDLIDLMVIDSEGIREFSV